MTLLEQAIRAKTATHHPKFQPDELLEMALAVLASEITVAEAKCALYPSKLEGGGYHSMAAAKLLSSLKTAVAVGRIRIVKDTSS